MKKGKIEVTLSKQGKKIFTLCFTNDKGEDKKQPIINPESFDFPSNYNGGECEFELDNGQLSKFLIDGKEYSKRYANKQEQGKKVINLPSSKSNASSTNVDNNMRDSLDINSTKIPKDTKSISITEIDNFHLKLNRFARFDKEDKDKPKFFKKDRRESFRILPSFDKAIIEKTNKSTKDIVDTYKSKGYEIVDSNFRPDWRLVVGLGGDSVYETSITLHHIYGIPYIPASAIKGVMRSYIITELFDKNEEKALKDKDFVHIFGDEDNAGKVIFFDAFPTEKPTISVDVMNPHYSDYYSGKTPPADYLSPIPIFFLTVVDTCFQFAIAIKDNNKVGNKLEGNTIKDIVDKFLVESLSENGIGAKTAVGYGYLKECEKIQPK